MAWAYLVGGDGDGQFVEHDPERTSAPDRSGVVMLAGPGGWVYRSSDQHVTSPGRGRCWVYQAHGQWAPYPGCDDQRADGASTTS